MVKDITVFADVHAVFDDDFSGVYLTQSDYDLVAAATRQKNPLIQTGLEAEPSDFGQIIPPSGRQEVVTSSARHFEATKTAELSELRDSSQNTHPSGQQAAVTNIETEEGASTDIELADALSAYEDLPQESINKVRVKRCGTGLLQRVRKSRRAAFYSTTKRPESTNESHHHKTRRAIKCSGNCVYKKRLQECFKGLPESFDDEKLFPPQQHHLLVLDDIIFQASDNQEVVRIFTQYRHHKNLSVIMLTQNVFHQGKFSRTISLNSNYLILFKNPRDKMQVNVLANQICPSNRKFFLESFEDATKEPHGYLLIDLTPSCPEQYRLRTGVLPSQWPVVYIPKQ
ncbi:uncharacterized protein ACBT44_012388 isoform 1-T1 [Syngnathus typhle]